MERCRICGARLFEGSTHCARCLSPIEATEGEIAEAVVDVAAASGRWRDTSAHRDVWRPDVRHIEPGTSQVHSRVRAGVFSFSLPTKIAITAVVALGLPFVAWQLTGGLAILSIAFLSITVTPLVLRDLWRRTRIR